MYSTPGGPAPQQQLIQQLARSFGGQPTPPTPIRVPPQTAANPQLLNLGRQAFQSSPAQFIGAPYPLQAPNQGAALHQGQQFFNQPGPLDPAVATAMGAAPTGLHPAIQAALEHVRSRGLFDPTSPENVYMQGIGAHPQVDRFHAIHASQNLATLMAELSSRSLKRNQFGGRH